ncbi:MAG: DUF4279 domain-containing protein [Lysobacter sp.]|nr:DUF4279 domain-containing protein [Lysobacter sp.]
MGIAEYSRVTLRIFGDDLVPDEVTSLMGCTPESACAKGDIRIGSKTGRRHEERTGRWSLQASRREPEDIPDQISEILGRLPQDPAVWRRLGAKYQIDLFCGVFMRSTNDGLSFPADILRLLSERGIALNIDVYAPHDDASDSDVSTQDA